MNPRHGEVCAWGHGYRSPAIPGPARSHRVTANGERMPHPPSTPASPARYRRYLVPHLRAYASARQVEFQAKNGDEVDADVAYAVGLARRFARRPPGRVIAVEK